MKHLAFLIPIILLCSPAFAQRPHPATPTSTGGPLMFEQAAYDVQSYEVSVNVSPGTQTIAGGTLIVARTVIPTNVIVLDLDEPYVIENVSEGTRGLKYDRKAGQIWVWFPATKQEIGRASCREECR